VIPAATRLSTWYWISGFPAMGIISFGIALDAGRKRVPYPAIVMMPFIDVDSSQINESET
jgi:hypothetical protein